MMDTYSVSQDDGETSSPAAGKRPRAKQACEPCRLRKRRCDGAMPCNMCRQFEYKCYFEKHPRKRSKLVEQNAHHEHSPDYVRPEPPAQDRSTAEDTLKARSMEANSGIAFTRLLGQRLDPSFGPKLFSFAWNLGMVSYVPPPFTPITEFLDQDEMYALAKAHFDHIHILYGFLDKEWVLQQITMRWAQPEHCTIPDHLLANLAAVGSLYGDATLYSRIPALLESAKKALEATSLMQPPNVIDVQSWLLRCMYLRSTGHPHACHTATCIVMHLVEAIGLHEETSNTTLHPPTTTVQGPHQSAEIRRRTFWSARMINTWVSFECGRSRVTLRGITTQLPTPRDGDYTLDYLNLYSLSCFLDPERSESQWEDFLRQLDEYECKHDAIEMSKGNLALCGYRRIRLVNPNPSSEITNSIIRIGLNAVEAAHRLCQAGVPWWHMANVPFQAICVFLAMDLRESLSHISAVLEVLEEVVERFPTASSKEALKMARSLVRLSKRRKDEDSDILGQTLKRSASKGQGTDISLVTTPQPPADGEVLSGAVETSPNTLSNGEDWAFDVVNNSDFDWNVFLTAEMPAFNSFAPDGTM